MIGLFLILFTSLAQALVGVPRPNVTRIALPENLITHDGKVISLGEAARDTHGIIFLFRDPQCPISQKNSALIRNYRALLSNKKLLTFHVALHTSKEQSAKISKDLEDNQLKEHYLLASDNVQLLELVPRSTTEAIVVDRFGRVLYRGAISSSFEVGYTRSRKADEYLVNALKQILSAKPVTLPITRAPGCAVEDQTVGSARSWEPKELAHIQQVVERSCVRCHYENGPTPLPFLSLSDLAKKRFTAAATIRSNFMPPWKADSKYGPWEDDYSLRDDERTKILTWLDDPGPLPYLEAFKLPQPQRPDWQNGKPDLILSSEKFKVPASGSIFMKYVYVPTNTTSDRWLRGIEFRSKTSALHHIILNRKTRPAKPENFFKEPTLIARFGPGVQPLLFKEDQGVFLPKGATLALQLHFTPDGQEHLEQLEIGFRYHSAEPAYIIDRLPIEKYDIRIPPGEANFIQSHSMVVGEDLLVMGFLPHMHLRGKTIRIDMQPPNEPPRTIFVGNNFDFNWQQFYFLKNYLKIAKGSRITLTGEYDNSAENLRNPDPSATVVHGIETEREMLRATIVHLRANAKYAVTPAVEVKTWPKIVFGEKTPQSPGGNIGHGNRIPPDPKFQ